MGLKMFCMPNMLEVSITNSLNIDTSYAFKAQTWKQIGFNQQMVKILQNMNIQ